MPPQLFVRLLQCFVTNFLQHVVDVSASFEEFGSFPSPHGGELGFLGILHTWTRQLAYHPHVHYIVPGGGLRPDGGKWRKCRITKKGEPYLLPVELLSHHFRHRFKERLRAQAPEIFNAIASQVWLVDWVVHSQSAGAGREALGYLSAYVFRTALSNKRLMTSPSVTSSHRPANPKRSFSMRSVS